MVRFRTGEVHEKAAAFEAGNSLFFGDDASLRPAYFNHCINQLGDKDDYFSFNPFVRENLRLPRNRNEESGSCSTSMSARLL